MSSKCIFNTDTNCWQISEASYSSPLIDCANYYRALHSSICKAKKQIVIIGWDIDSRIELLHGEEAERSEAPVAIGELIKWKAEQNPELKVFMLRWDSSFAFFDQREMWALEVWQDKTPDNVIAILDDSIPMGGSQHQKIALIDDEVVFSGGMDVALHRWDTREHIIDDSRRTGPDGEYGPFHDVQIVSCGPVVEHFKALACWRWNRVAEQPMPEFSGNTDILSTPPESWPDNVKPCFTDVDCAIARTIPEMEDTELVQEVRQMLLDIIGKAEKFIYIENQFATREEIAQAINARMKECPDLHVVIVSSYEPKGLFESEAYWASRITFKNIIEEGIDDKRVMMTYSSIRDQQGRMAYKRIHSKVMAIDNQYLVIGSSNLSNRSMSLDTEVDLIFHGDNEENQGCIEFIRNDLLAEHTGRKVDEMPELLNNQSPVTAVMEGQLAHGYVLTEVDDSEFTTASETNLFRSISDPEEPLGPSIPDFQGKFSAITNPRRRTIMIALGVIIVALIAGALILISNTVPWLDGDRIQAFLEESRGTYFALPTVLLVYVVGGLLFFPVTVLSLAVAAIFGPIWGPIYGIFGALLSAGITFVLGKLLGNAGLRKLGGPKVEAVDEKLKQSGIIGVAAIRMLPIAPFSLVNLVAGISSISLVQFLIGTFLGMFPQMVAKGLVGDSIMQIFKNPSAETVTYLVGGLVFWLLMIVGSQKVAKMYQSKKAQAEGEDSEECIA